MSGTEAVRFDYPLMQDPTANGSGSVAIEMDAPYNGSEGKQGVTFEERMSKSGRPSDMRKARLSDRKVTMNFPTATLSWADVLLTAKVKKSVLDKMPWKKGVEADAKPRVFLDRISGVVKPGEMLAVMGPSGAGKTTLLDALANRGDTGDLSGEVYINGRKPGPSFAKISAYVPQQEKLFGCFTVREALRYSARLRLPSTMSSAAKDDRVEEIIDALGLGTCADSRIGGAFGLSRGISGGEKRRTSIGTELVTGPSLLFMDEPTSALDSWASFNVVSLMRNLAHSDRTIIATIHQPDYQTFMMFDKLMLLSRGRIIYFGSTGDQLINWFSSLGHPCPPFENPADFYLRMANIDFYIGDEKAKALEHLTELADEYEQSPMKREVDDHLLQDRERDIPADPPVSTRRKWAQLNRDIAVEFATLFSRSWNMILKDPEYMVIRVISFTIVGIVLGTSFPNLATTQQSIQSRFSIFFALASFLSFLAMGAIPTFMLEKEIVSHERANGSYRVESFVLSQFCAALPWYVVLALMPSLTLYFITNLQRTFEAWIYFLANLFFTLLCADGVAMIIALISPAFVVAVSISLAVFGYFMMVCGFLIVPNQLPAFWRYLGYYEAYMTYTYDGLAKNEFLGLTFQTNQYCLPVTGDPSCQTTGLQVLESQGFMLQMNKGGNIGILFLMMFGFRVIYYLLLKFVFTAKRRKDTHNLAMPKPSRVANFVTSLPRDAAGKIGQGVGNLGQNVGSVVYPASGVVAKDAV